MLSRIVIKKGKERAIYNRHPWIFSGAAESIPTVENGEIVEIRTFDQKLLGYGFYAPGTQILSRVFEYTDQETNVLSEDFWFNKIKKAFDIRQKFLVNKQTNAYRLLNAEGDFFPGIIADVYNNTVVLQLLIKGTERSKRTTGRCAFGNRLAFGKNRQIGN